MLCCRSGVIDLLHFNPDKFHWQDSDLNLENVDHVCESFAVYCPEVDMLFQCSHDFQREACARLLAGESVKSLAAELSVTEATLRWKKQELIDYGRLAAIKSTEIDELAPAQRTIRDLQAELTLVKAASALFNDELPFSPKGSSRLLED